MKTKIIKSKRASNGILELIEFTDDFGKIIKHEIALGCMQKNVIGGGTGAFKKVKDFEDKNKAIKFFDNVK